MPAASLAVPAAMLMASEPEPVIADNVTVRAEPVPLTASVAAAVPVEISVTCASPSVTVVAPV